MNSEPNQDLHGLLNKHVNDLDGNSLIKDQWFEIRCNTCNRKRFSGLPRMLLKISVLSLDGGSIDKPSRKIGIEAKCKDCKQLTYKVLVV